MKRDIWLPRIASMWAGTVVGCSFIATPAKFQAASLSLPPRWKWDGSPFARCRWPS